jgi:hypothetical protein
MPDVGNGATIAFGTSSFTAGFTMIGGTEQERAKLEITVLATTGKKLFMPDDLYDPGGFDLEFFFDPNEQPPISGAIETVTITFPIPSGGMTGATLAGTAFCGKWKAGDCKPGEPMRATARIEWTGATGPTWTDSTS